MSLTYEKSNQPIVVADAALLYPLPAPSRQSLRKLIAVHASGSAFTLDVYNRKFVGTAATILSISDNGDGNCRIHLLGDPQVKVNDPVVVASNSVAGYNTTHRVTAVRKLSGGSVSIDTSVAFTAVGSLGTATLTITGTEQSLYRVLPTQTAVSGIVTYNDSSGVLFENQEPKRHDGSSYERKIYLKFSATGTYRVSLGFVSNESLGS